MHAIKIRKHIDSDVLYLPVPKEIIGKNAEIIVLIDPEDALTMPKTKRKPGSAKGFITMSDDFEAPLDDGIIGEFYK